MRDFPFLGKNAENKEKKKEIKLSDFNFQIFLLLFHRSTFMGSIQCQVCLAFTMHSTFKGSPPTRAISLSLLLPWDQLFTTMNLLRIDIILLFEAVRINYGQTIILPPFLSLSCSILLRIALINWPKFHQSWNDEDVTPSIEQIIINLFDEKKFSIYPQTL